MKKLFAILVLFLASCQPSQQSIQTAIAQTQAVLPTDAIAATLTPTDMPLPTNTLVPSATPTVTVPPTSTFTPTATFTATPLPATQTAEALHQTQTMQARNANATKSAISANATATKQAQSYSRTSTALAIYATASEIAKYKPIDNKELKTYPDNHKGEYVKVQGRIFNIISNEQFQIFLGWTYDAAFIVAKEPFSGLYEDDSVTIYGVVAGQNCGENAYGAQICQPLIIDAIVVKGFK